MEKFLQFLLNPFLRRRHKTMLMIWQGRKKKD
jgi:hypothetical protein